MESGTKIAKALKGLSEAGGRRRMEVKIEGQWEYSSKFYEK